MPLTTEDSSNADTCTVAVRLPAFSPNETLTWFRRAEIQFRLKKITSPTTKSDYVLEALPETVFRRVAPWLDEQPDTIDYNDLKKHLLREYSLSSSERAKRIIAMPGGAIGDRTASQVWNEISVLCRIPILDLTNNTTHQEVDLKKEIWLQCLPDHIRALMYDTDDTKMPDLIKKADALMEAHKMTQAAQPVVPINHAATSEKEQPIKQQNRRRSPFATLTDSGICTYHERFGAKARSCVDGCVWASKNARGGR